MELDRKKLMMLSIIVVLIVASACLGSEYQRMLEAGEDAKIAEQNSIFQEGVNQGYQLAVLQLLQQASTCQTVPVTAENMTLNMIAVECLEQQAAE